MPDTPAKESASARWQKRIQESQAAASKPVDTSKDVLAYIQDIFGEDITTSFGVRRQGNGMIKIETIEIDGLHLDVANISGWDIVTRLNQYAPQDPPQIACATKYDGVSFHVSIDLDVAKKMMDVAPDVDPPVHPPTLRGYLTQLAMEKNPPKNVTSITGFTPRGRSL